VQLDDKPPWSNNQLKKLGKAIREGREQDASDLRYDDVVIWYGELANIVQTRIESLDFKDALRSEIPQVSARPKTIGTLREKLIAHPTWALPSIIDVAGVRVEAGMTLSEQDVVARIIAEELHQNVADVASDSRIVDHSGYRALHLRTVFQAGRVEVQVRTSAQSAWANTFEEFADHAGRQIRYGGTPTSPRNNFMHHFLLLLSASTAHHELAKDSIGLLNFQGEPPTTILQRLAQSAQIAEVLLEKEISFARMIIEDIDEMLPVGEHENADKVNEVALNLREGIESHIDFTVQKMERARGSSSKSSPDSIDMNMIASNVAKREEMTLKGLSLLHDSFKRIWRS
jgi:ppGpp synthetase/RelA/SpoT-type nucleotidyltranferase